MPHVSSSTDQEQLLTGSDAISHDGRAKTVSGSCKSLLQNSSINLNEQEEMKTMKYWEQYQPDYYVFATKWKDCSRPMVWQSQAGKLQYRVSTDVTAPMAHSMRSTVVLW